ncbi:C45 family peptidase [Streptosporangium sp. KLBMP 9127]|nr:C45 family peptidase [Streptosporangium sp. KLBMP 9127]
MSFPAFTSTEIGPNARGREFGARWRTAVAANLTGYLALFEAGGAGEARLRTWGEQSLDRTAGWAPALAEEITGIAAGAGLDPWQVSVLNARTEILAALRTGGEGECSTSVVLPGGGRLPRTIQTWDWHDHLSEAPVLWGFEPRPGHTVRTFTEYGVLGKIGVNGAGLGAHFNILRHASDHADMGVPVHMVARRILDEAATVEEATEIARSARVSASTVISVVTSGAAAAIEVCPAGVAVVPAGPDGVLLHSNHFLDPVLAPGERLGTERAGTYARLDHLRTHTGELADADPTRRARAMLSHAPQAAPVCAHADPALPMQERWTTLATVALDVAAGRMLVHRGGPCQVEAATWQTF